MVTAFVMIHAQTDSIPECAERLSELDGVSEVYSVAGEWDLIAIVRIPRYEDLAEVISNRVNKVDGVVETTTHLAFRAYSQHDLDAAFSLGLE